MAQIALRKYNIEISELIDHGQIDEAIAHCRHVLRTYPRHVETYRLLGKAYLESQRYGDATDILQRVLSSLPDDFIAHIGMSIIREDEGNIESAVWHMERAFEVNPSNQAIQGELRRLYGRRDGVPPSKIRLTRGALARMYAHGDLYQQAIDELLAALSEDPQRPDLDVLLAEMYYMAEKHADAADTANKLTQKLPNCLQANRLLTILLTRAERPDDHIEPFRERWYNLDPYAAALNELTDDPMMLRDDAVLVDHLDYDGMSDFGADDSQPQWAASLGVDLAEESEDDWFADLDSGTPDDDSGSLFGDDASDDDGLSRLFADDAPESAAEGESDPLAWLNAPDEADEADQPAAQAAEDDWLTTAAEASVAGGFAAGALDDAADDDDDLPLFDDVKDIIAPTRPNPTDSDAQDDDEDMSWLDELTGASAPVETAAETAAVDDDDDDMSWLDGLASDVQQEMAAEAATDDEPIDQSDDLSWLDQPGSSDEPAAAGDSETDEDLGWLHSLGGDSETSAAADDDDESMDWLADLTGEVRAEMRVAAETTPDIPSDASVASDDDDDLDWLNLLDDDDAQPSAETGAEADVDMPDFLTEAGWEPGSGEGEDSVPEPISASEDEITSDMPEWLQELEPGQQPPASEETLTDQPTEWLDEARAESSGEMPDWMQEFSAQAGDEDAADDLPGVGEDTVTRRLDGADVPEEATIDDDAFDEVPDFTTDAEHETQPAEDEDLDWLADLESKAKQPAAAQLNTGDLQWLDDLVNEGGDAVETSEPETDDIDAEPEPVVEMVVEPDGGDDDEDLSWLDALTDEVRDEMNAPPVSEASDEQPDWLIADDEDDDASDDDWLPETVADASEGEDWDAETAEDEAEDTVVAANSAIEPETQPAQHLPRRRTVTEWLRSLDDEDDEALAAQERDTDELAAPEYLPDAPGEPKATHPTDWVPEKVAATLPADDETNGAPRASDDGPPRSQLVDEAAAAIEANDIDRAVKIYSRAIQSGKQINAVVDGIREALRRHPVDVRLWEKLGDAYMKNGQLQQAMDSYTKAENLMR